MLRIKDSLKYIAIIPFVAVVLLFAVAYASYLILGANNVIELVDEEILRDEFGVGVDFELKKNKEMPFPCNGNNMERNHGKS